MQDLTLNFITSFEKLTSALLVHLE